MLANFLLGLSTMVLCLLLQTLLLMVATKHYINYKIKVNKATFWASVLELNSVMLLLVIGNLGQIAIWAFLFQWLGEFQPFSTAFYHSAVNFGSLGYGDIVMSEQHRLLGALEAINGVLMIGLSTAVLMTVFQDVRKELLSARGNGAK